MAGRFGNRNGRRHLGNAFCRHDRPRAAGCGGLQAVIDGAFADHGQHRCNRRPLSGLLAWRFVAPVRFRRVHDGRRHRRDALHRDGRADRPGA